MVLDESVKLDLIKRPIKHDEIRVVVTGENGITVSSDFNNTLESYKAIINGVNRSLNYFKDVQISKVEIVKP